MDTRAGQCAREKTGRSRGGPRVWRSRSRGRSAGCSSSRSKPSSTTASLPCRRRCSRWRRTSSPFFLGSWACCPSLLRSRSRSTETESLDGSTGDLVPLAAAAADGGGTSSPPFSVSRCCTARCRFFRAAGACCCCQTSRSGLSLHGSPALRRLAHAGRGEANAHASASSSSEVSPPSPAAKRGGGGGGTAWPQASQSSATTLWRRCRLLADSALARQEFPRSINLQAGRPQIRKEVDQFARSTPASRTLRTRSSFCVLAIGSSKLRACERTS